MNPSTGTFTTMDTYAGSIFDPTSLHKYLYANANPVMNSDPSGYATLTGTQVAVLGATFIAAAIASNSTWAMNVYKNIRSSFAANSHFVPKYIFQIDDIFIMQIASGLLTSADANDEVSTEITSGATSGTGAASPDPKNNKNKKKKSKKNKHDDPYPSVVDPRTGEDIPFPEGELSKVPKDERVEWDGGTRHDYIKEWKDRGYGNLPGDWGDYDIHHIRPREYGGTNDFDNLVPLLREIHKLFTKWWAGF